MSFKKYPSIENHYNEKFISRIKEKFPNLKYAVFEKIDGMNVSVVIEGTKVTGVYSRNGHDISQGEYKNFFDNFKWALEYSCCDEIPANCLIYGELYGNNIQKNIKYLAPSSSRSVQFRIFDIYLTEENRFLNITEWREYGFNNPFWMVPEYARDLTLEEALEFDVENLKSKTSEVDAIVEGVIIRPMIETQLSPYDRLILKHKTEKFREVRKTKKAIPNSQLVVEGFGDFINENRVNSVKSKRPYELPRETGALINDVISDATEEYQKIRRELSVGEILSVRKNYSRIVANLIKSLS